MPCAQPSGDEPTHPVQHPHPRQSCQRGMGQIQQSAGGAAPRRDQLLGECAQSYGATRVRPWAAQ